MISVVLATYNGERFLDAQLATIAAQTQLPDELVVTDDGSTDSTCDRVRSFAAGAPFPVRLITGRERLGVPANFGRGIAEAAGTIIVLADQDDTWVPERIARLVAALDARPDAQAAFSDAVLMDGDGVSTGRRQWDVVGFAARDRAPFRPTEFDPLAQQRVLARFNPVTGATMAFRASLKAVALPIDSNGYHDLWIAFLAAATGGLVAVEEPLVNYRIHESNAVGARRSARQRLRRRLAGAPVFGSERAHYEAMRERLAGMAGRASLDPRTVALLDAKVAHMRFREELSCRVVAGRAWPTIAELVRGRYRRFSRGVESWAFDAFFRGVHSR